MKAELNLDIEETVRRVVREEIERAGNGPVVSLFNVKSAAAYLDTTEDALRALLKRGQIECLRSETGRLTFTREQLDSYAAGGA